MLDVNSIIQGGGLLLIALVIFAESGMFVGFFFPGDTLLLSAGIFSAAGELPALPIVIAVIALAAILGDNTGYFIGKRYGRKLFRKPDGLVFRQSYVLQAEAFYERWGSKTMLVAHFVPVVRTFASPVAGIAHMPYRKFFLYDAVGDIVWAASITAVGYWFGSKVPHLTDYIHYVLLGVIVITLGPTVYHLLKAIREKRRSDPTPPTGG